MEIAVIIGLGTASCIAIVLYFLITNKQRKKALFQLIATKRKRKGVNEEMQEVVNKYLNKFVGVHTINDYDEGELISFVDGWITLRYKGIERQINSDYIVKVEEIVVSKKKK